MNTAQAITTSEPSGQPHYGAFRTLRDAEQFGISPITGEACNLSLRKLCDVNAAGLALLEDYLRTTITLQDPTNSSVDGKPTVGCLLLAPAVLRDIARYGMASSGALAVVESIDGTLTPVYDQAYLDRYSAMVDSHEEQKRDRMFTIQRFSRGTGPRVGNSNVHMATGRVM